MTKPFIPEELVARVKALLRRPKSIEDMETIIHKEITITPSTGKVDVAGRNIDLTRKEFFMLELFLRKPNRIIDKLELIEKVWGISDVLSVSDNTISVTISRLRKKIGDTFCVKPIHNQ